MTVPSGGTLLDSATIPVGGTHLKGRLRDGGRCEWATLVTRKESLPALVDGVRVEIAVVGPVYAATD